MKRTLKSALALGLAATLSFSPVAAAPAYAGDRDQAIVAGTLGLLLLGTLAHAAGSANGHVSVTTQPRRNVHAPNTPPNRPRSEPRPHKPTVVVPSKGPNRPRHGTYGKPVLPRACAINARSGTYMAKACLERSGVSTRRMPQSCEVRLVTRTGDRARLGFSTRCLARAGYKVAGGRSSHR
ncbi:MAG: hypothetical protein ACRBCL_14410 [Maritimibacter sp.]